MSMDAHNVTLKYKFETGTVHTFQDFEIQCNDKLISFSKTIIYDVFCQYFIINLTMTEIKFICLLNY